MEQQPTPAAQEMQNAAKPRVPALSYLGLTLNLLRNDGLDKAPDGYRVFGNLMQEKDTDASYEYDRRTYWAPAIVKISRTEELRAATITAKSVADLRERYAASLGVKGSYGAFSTKAESEFSKEVHERSETLIITKQLLTDGWKLSLETGAGDYGQVLSPEFYADINNKSVAPEKIFEIYGTHVAMGVHAGGKVLASFTSRSNTKETIEKLAVTAEVSYGTVTVDGSISRDKQGLLAQSEIEDIWHVTGGTDAARMALYQKRTPEAYIQWAASVSQNPSFGSVTSVKPLWDFVAAPERRHELEAYFMLQLTLFSLQNLQLFRNHSGQAQHPKVSMIVPEQYKILSGGGRITSSGTGAMLFASYPVSQNQWHVAGKDHLEADTSAIAEALVIAVFDPYDFIEIKITSSTSPEESQYPVATATLPGEYLLTGGGANIMYAGTSPGNMLTASCPADTDPQHTSWIAKGKDHEKKSLAKITAYAIGMRTRSSAFRLRKNMTSDTGSEDAHSSKEVAVTYDGGYRLVGGGAQVNWTGFGHMLTGSYPDGNKWVGTGKDHLKSSPASLTVFAIGLKAEIVK